MIELIYVSKATKRYNEQELTNMLTQFRSNNTINNITGILLYNGRGTFLQLLEGEQDLIEALYSKIVIDKRHSRANCLNKTTIDKRSFPDWKMGFARLSKESVVGIEGYSDFLDSQDSVSFLINAPEFTGDLLGYFKQSAKANGKMGLKA